MNEQISQWFASWKEFLRYNAGEGTNEPIMIPSLPVEIRAKDLQILWAMFAEILGNTTGASLEIFFNADGSRQAVYLHRMNEQSLYVSCEEISESDIPKEIITSITACDGTAPDFQNICENQFEQCKNWIKSRFNADLGNLHLVSLDLLEQLAELYSAFKDNTPDLLQYYCKFIDIILDLYARKRFICIPKSPILEFLYQLTGYIHGFTIGDIISLGSKILPNFASSVTFRSIQNEYFTYLLNIENHQIKLKRTDVDHSSFATLEIVKYKKALAKQLKTQFQLKHNLLFELPPLKQFAQDLVESPIPLDAPRLKYLFQKALFWYRSRGITWDLSPAPAIYYPGVRFIFFTLGLRLNLLKISHWSLPYLVEFVVNRQWGLNHRICLLLGKSYQALTSPDDPECYGFVIEIENRVVKSAEKINNHEILLSSSPEIPVAENIDPKSKKKDKQAVRTQATADMHARLAAIRGRLIDRYGYINSVIWFSYDFLENGLGMFCEEFLGRQRFPLGLALKFFTRVQNPYDFEIFPLENIRNATKTMKTKELGKKIFPIITDLREY
jgi:uncharacterized protein YxeA